MYNFIVKNRYIEKQYLVINKYMVKVMIKQKRQS